MSSKLSRRKIAAYYAEQLLGGEQGIARELAAYLVDTGRIRELDLIIRDVEAALAERGVLLADVASSHDLTADARAEITGYLKQATGTKTVHLRESVEPELLGGVRLGVPGRELDASLRNRLNQLKATKI